MPVPGNDTSKANSFTPGNYSTLWAAVAQPEKRRLYLDDAHNLVLQVVWAVHLRCQLILVHLPWSIEGGLRYAWMTRK